MGKGETGCGSGGEDVFDGPNQASEAGASLAGKHHCLMKNEEAKLENDPP